jgi:hypothetical protein
MTMAAAAGDRDIFCTKWKVNEWMAKNHSLPHWTLTCRMGYRRARVISKVEQITAEIVGGV